MAACGKRKELKELMFYILSIQLIALTTDTFYPVDSPSLHQNIDALQREHIQVTS